MRDAWTSFFKVVSNILHPLLLPFIGSVLLFEAGSYSLYPLSYKWYAEGLILINTGVLPGILIWLLKKMGKISDLDVSIRSERLFPYLIMFITYAGTVYLLYRIHFPWSLIKLFMGVVLAIFLALFITLKWKISAHTMAFGCLVAGSFIVCLEQGIIPLFFLVMLLLTAGLQAASRIYLRAHTLGQVALGFVHGGVCVCSTYFLIP